MADRPAWVAQYLPALQRLGVSATSALRTFRAPVDAGGLGQSVSTSEFYKQWGASLNELANAEGFLAVNLGRRPTADQITQFPSRQATGFQYHFNVLVQNKSTGETYYTPGSYRSSTLVSFGNAKQRTIDAIVAAGEEYAGPMSEVDVLGAVPVNVREYVPSG